jgi:hypothetical protein
MISLGECSLDLALLSTSVREHIPSCSSAILVGSAVSGRGGCVADLDVTGLDDTVLAGHDRACEYEHAGWPVHVVLYHSAHFLAIVNHDQLLFLFLREVRKLLDGIVLFDEDGALGQTLDSLRALRIPYGCLEPLVALVRERRLPKRGTVRQRLHFYRAVEALSYAWMHFEMSYRYTKPKWLLEDAKRVVAEYLMDLLGGISWELIGSHRIGSLAEKLREHLSVLADGRMKTFSLGQLRDAESLIAADRSVEAVWPLRMATYMLTQAWAEQRGILYVDLCSIEAILPPMALVDGSLAALLRRILLLDRPLDPVLLLRWKNARSEFLEAWRKIQTGGGRSKEETQAVAQV